MGEREVKASSKVDSQVCYFAYGSNMHPRAMRAVCPNAKALGVALLNGRRLVFRGAISSVVDPNAYLEGVLWSLNGDEVHNLDAWERCPEIYLREEVTVAVCPPSPRAPAFIYVMRAKEAREGLGAPGAAYLALVLEAARIWGIPEQNIRAAAQLAGQAGNTQAATMPWPDEYWANVLSGPDQKSRHSR